MKGYLRRLVSPAAVAEAAVAPLHPMVGSYAAPPSREGFREETTFIAASSRPPVTPKVENARASYEPPRRETPAPVQQPAADRARPAAEADRPLFQPLLSVRQTPAPPLQPPVAPSRQPQESTTRLHPDVRPADKTPGPDAYQQIFLEDSSSEPQRPSAPPRHESARDVSFLHLPHPLPVEPRSPTTGVRRAPAPQGPREFQPQREADEIHINIGRIEVTAMPPAPARPPAPPRKSLNLDDYLRRGNGRTG